MSHCAKRWAGRHARMLRSWAGWQLCGASATTSTSAQSAPSVPINGERPLAEEQSLRISSVQDARDMLFLARGKRCVCRRAVVKGCQIPRWSRRIQARLNQSWARCSLFLPPPPADSKAMKERHGNAVWTGRRRHVGVQRAHFPLSQAWSTD